MTHSELTQATSTDDRGAMAIMIAILTLVFAAIAAFVIDVGALYEERRDLQNGAEAAALAIAIDCADGLTCTPGATAARGDAYAGLNSNDGESTVDPSDVCFGPSTTCFGTETVAANEVMVRARTQDNGPDLDGDPSTVDHFFARIFGNGGTEVFATAKARWGTPGGLATLPLTFSICEWENLVPDPDAAGAFPTDPATIVFHDSQLGGDSSDDDCIANAGQDEGIDGARAPGGFGNLWTGDPPDCMADIVLVNGFGVAGRMNGGSLFNANMGCSGLDADDFTDRLHLIPIYDLYIPDDEPLCMASAFSQHGCYRIIGFGALYIEAMRFPGNADPTGFRCSDVSNPPTAEGTPPVGNGDSCVVGHFESVVSVEDALGGLVPGGGGFGVTVVELSG